ncbi:diacylglycerol kinase family lipid kinase [Alkalihalophilus pseudofirmus]|uniref:diacylglycerol/lipid kinase family protein n=1 Tax=Alkalihalophilus pseudofirmus TaxID=79885 RepID=UPI00259BF1E6|nr:diacylglycerol kinase family protein [Alkalihalophilus pseudofirmus]WEG15383.1 diacylglycerol kinase family lipid kinase [Alkalihalophilus pseudofirmus]
MYNKAMLIYNGSAGSNDIKASLAEAVEGLESYINELTLMKTLKKGDAETFCLERASQFDLIIIMGGDGTVHECVNGLIKLKESPPIFILPTGTCNDFARSLNIPLKIDAACEAFEEAKMIQSDIGTVNGRAFSNFFGVGLITKASEGTNDDLKQSIGKFSYFVSALQSMQQAAPFSYTLKTKEGVENDEAVMILAMNGHSLGTTSLYHEKSSLTDGLLDIYLIREAGLSLLKNLFNKATSPTFPDEMEGIDFIQTSSFELEIEQKEEVDIDGEIYLETPASVHLDQKSLPFLSFSINQ